MTSPKKFPLFKRILLLVLVGFVLLTLAFFLIQSRNTTPQVQEITRIYTSDTYNFSFTYPSELQTKEYLPENIIVGHVSDEAVDGVVEVSVMTVEGEAGKTVQEVVAMQLQTMCAADGPTSSFSCTEVITNEPFTTNENVEGTELYLLGELKDLQTGETSQVEKGPYYVLTLATSATGSRVLVVQPPLNQTAQEAEKETIQTVAESVQLHK